MICKLVPPIRLTCYSLRPRSMLENLFEKCFLIPRCYTNYQDFLRSGQLDSTFALKLRPYLSPAYLFPLYSTISPFSKFLRCCTRPSSASHLYCERSFTKLKVILSYMGAVWGKIDSVIWPYH